MNLAREIQAAEKRIAAHARMTPVELSHVLSRRTNTRCYLKLENFQRTGSFKFRGALNRLLSLEEDVRSKGVVAASSGNHGMAVACGAAQIGIPATVFVPTVAAPVKVDAIRGYGAEVREEGDDCLVAEENARAHAEANGLCYVSPYNDYMVMAGQGTIGLELLRALDDLDAIFIAVGGGGLIGGIGSIVKALRPSVEIVACSPANSPVLHASLEAGRIVEMECRPTLSDGTAGGMEKEAITFDICRDVIDRSVVVEEDEIAAGVRLLVEQEHMLAEGAAGVAVAAFLREAERLRDKSVAIVVCGANIGTADLARVIG